jgi:hypothetical protein
MFIMKRCKNAPVNFAMALCPHAAAEEPLNGFS